MVIERRAVTDYSTVQMLVEQAEAINQRVNGAQHGPGDIIGIYLIAAHHQQCRALLWRRVGGQQPVGAEQALLGGVVGLAAGAMQQLVDATAQDKIRQCPLRMEQMRCPVGNACAVIDQQVVGDVDVAGQCLIQRHVDQVDERAAAHRDDLTLLPIQRVIPGGVGGGNLQPKRQAQLPRSDQPQHQSPWFKAAQHGASEDGRQCICGRRRGQGHPARALWLQIGRG